MADRIARFFGLQDESPRVKYLAKVAAVFMPLAAASFMMSSTFFAVFVAEILVGPALYLSLGMALVGQLALVGSIVQLVFDFPTGGVGDWIGQRWILLTAFLCFAASTILTAFATTYIDFLLVYVLSALGAAQQSGAIAAWFDNNYRAAAKDPDRSAYSVAQGRMGMLFQIAATVSLIPGAVLADLISRQGVFFLQGIICIIMGVSSLILFRDFPEVAENRPKRSLRVYYSLLKEGLKFSVSSRFVFFYIIGSVLFFSAINVWGSMILMIVYYSFLYEQKSVAIFRTVIFAFGILWTERTGVWTRKMSPRRWIAVFRYLQVCGPFFLIGIAAIFVFLPPVPGIPFPFTFFQLPTILVCIAFIAGSLSGSAANLLVQRLLLDMIPDRNRNSLYSLFPTLQLLLAVPQLLIFSLLLPAFPPPFGTVVVLVGLCGISITSCVSLAYALRKIPEGVLMGEHMPHPLTADVDSTPTETEA
ncbi:MAG: MFS transporter [Promethearchaeota archaeon]